MRRGTARVAGVATAAARDAVLSLREERGLPSFSRALGVALEEWRVCCRDGACGRKEVQEGSAGPPDASRVVHPEPAPITLDLWQEATGTVRTVLSDGEGVHVVLEDAGRAVELVLPGGLKDRPGLVAGSRVSILRTDIPARGYLVRSL